MTVSLPPAMPLRDYQWKWIQDPARFLFWVKSARIGASHATGIRYLLKALARPNYTCTVLSPARAQSVEFIQAVAKNVQLMGEVAELTEEPFADELGATDILVHKIGFANGSRILALPGNARTARGYPGDIVLDEFAHHQDSYAIWAAAIRQTALGNEAAVLSTPNGEQGKYFDLATMLGLTDGVAPRSQPVLKMPWSGHWTDVYMAVAQGCPIDIPSMKAAVGDDDTWQQEFGCIFLKAAGAWLPLELLIPNEDDAATVELPSSFRPRGSIYIGIDVGRERDATCIWVNEMIGDVAWTRAVIKLRGMSFPDQAARIRPLLEMASRAAIDSTGMGIGLYDILAEDFRSVLMGVNFSGSTKREERPNATSADAADSMKLKTKLAIDLKRELEMARIRLPRDDRDIRSELMAVKRESTATGVKFDAPRIEVDSAVAGGGKKKQSVHADAFWALSLAVFSAKSSPLTLGIETSDNYRGILSTSEGFM